MTMNTEEPALFRSQKMGIMSLIKWTFLLSAALMFFHTHMSSTQSCNKSIFIADFNPSTETPTSLNGSQACNNFSFAGLLNQCQSGIFPGIMDKCFIKSLDGVPTLGICPFGISNYSFNVTKHKDRYEISVSEDVSGLSLHFLLNAYTLLPSSNISSAGILQLQNVIHLEQCRYQVYNFTPCTGSNSYYIIAVLQNKSIDCTKCNPSPSSSPSQPGTTHGTSIETALEFIKTLKAKLGDDKDKLITSGNVTGLILKQLTHEDVSIGYSKNHTMQIVTGRPEKQFAWSVKIPGEAFNMARSKLNETPFVAVLRVPDLALNDSSVRVLKNEIIGITMGTNIVNLTHSIDIFFSDVEKTNMIMTCNSWDETASETPQWTTFGCDTQTFDNNSIQCSCTHLTFFAILMSPPGQVIPEADVTTLTYITSIGCGLSTFFLLVGLFIHFVMWRTKSRLGTTILMNLFVALSLLNITFLSNQQITNTNATAGCITIAAVMHFSLLATFTWFFIQGLHFYLTLTAFNMNNRRFKASMLALGWGFPALVVIVIAASRTYTYLTNVQMCWITNIYIHYIINVGYYALIFIFTLVVLIMITRKITKTSIIRTKRKKITAIFGLTVLLGLTWGVAFFSYGAMAIPSYYIFTILNSFQGFFLFLYYYYFRNDDIDLNQSSSNTVLSVRKPNNLNSTMTITSEAVTES
ncbi:hypothetical protein NFI96_018582 [Prochilodus magdalenae]|nr:hypothetical protein NFI96_018582 [Prochilodus magdalenae]